MGRTEALSLQLQHYWSGLDMQLSTKYNSSTFIFISSSGSRAWRNTISQQCTDLDVVRF